MSVTTIKVTESEKSPALYSANWKEQVLLKRRLADIERTKDTVRQRITLDQRIVYKRFQTKRLNSELTHARIIGDKESERSLRATSAFSTFNTNCGVNEEEDNILQKILQRRPEKQTVSARAVSAPVKPGSHLHRSKSAVDVTDDNKARPATSYHTYINTSTNRCQTASGVELNVSQTESSVVEISTPQTRKSISESQLVPKHRSKSINIFEDPDERHRSILREINKRRLNSACHDDRVKEFCQTVSNMKFKSFLSAYDYYNRRLIEETEINPMTVTRKMPGTPEAEFYRHLGNLRVKTMTTRTVHSPWLPLSTKTSITTLKDTRRRKSKSSSIRVNLVHNEL